MGKQGKTRKDKKIAQVPEKKTVKGENKGLFSGIKDRLMFLEDVIFSLFFFCHALAFTTEIQVHFTLPKLAVLRVFSFLITLLGIYRIKRGDIKGLPKTISYTVIILGLWWIFSSFFAIHKPTALHGVYGRYNALLNHEIYLLLFFVFASLPMDRERIERIIKLFVYALVPVSLYAILQFHRIDFIPWPMGRSSSTTGNPVILGALLGLAMPFALTFFFMALRKGFRHPPLYLWSTIFLILIYGGFSTLSRGPWWGMIFSTGIIMVVNFFNRNIDRRRLAIASIVFAIFCGVIFVSNYGNIKRVTESIGLYLSKKTDTPLATRIMYYKVAIEGIKDHPITGVGFENFRIIYPRYRPVEDNIYFKDVIPTMVHNGYLQTALTNGIPALLLYILLLFLILRGLIRAYRRSQDIDIRFLTIACIASITGYLVQDIFGWLEIALTPFFWIILGLSVSLSLIDTERPPITGWKKRIYLGVGILCALALMYLISDAINRIQADRLFWKSQSMNPLKEWHAIEANIKEGLSSMPDDFYYEDIAGLLYMKRFNVTGDGNAYKQGTALLERAHYHNPFDVYVLIHRIDFDVLALRKGFIKQASPFVERSIKSVIAMDKNNPTVYESISNLRLFEGRYGEALQMIKTAQTLKPNHHTYLLFEADIYRAMNDMKKAGDIFKKIIEKLDGIEPPSLEWIHAKFGLVHHLMMMKNLDEAMAEVDSVIKRVPHIAQAYVIKGDIYAAQGRFEKAKEAFLTAQSIEPGNPYAKRGLEQLEKFTSRR
ncbi:MAG: O-antigen ligase family protein [Syntrophorhabdaceae bacterium]|nr:O-antigen ligase family protein [Syntrophorhabdaceae bacterium]